MHAILSAGLRAGLVLVLAAGPLAGTARAQSCSSLQCQGTWADVTAFAGNVSPGAGCDTCPGHCVLDPSVVCTSSTCAAPVGGSCSFATTVYFGHCTNPSRLGRACNGNGNCYVSDTEPGTCDGYTTPFGGDGLCTIAYYNLVSTAATVTGTDGADLVCLYAASGPVTISTGLGADRIYSGAASTAGTTTINAGDGDDYVSGGANVDVVNAGTGNNVVYGNGGNDQIVGGGGDDLLAGGDGNDLLVGQGGRDVLRGDAGADTLVENYGGPVVNDVVGAVLCGGAGDDELIADGPGHQCMDAGADQTVTTSDPDDCVYANLPDDTDDHDVGTGRNCAHGSRTSSGGTLLDRPAPCGCD